ncbi:MAG: hypothetical protein R3F21_20945 [Myxococcota bacterium]
MRPPVERTARLRVLLGALLLASAIAEESARAMLATEASTPMAIAAIGTETKAVSERYEANALHRFVFGDGYRALWSAPLELPVLDLEHEAGGLVATRRFGGLQTAVLAFENAEGRSFTFRASDKNPAAVLHPMLLDTIVERLVQDHMSAQHPGGALAAGVIAERAGLLGVDERLVVLPDDPRLGAHREEFAGRVGTFFEYPIPRSETQPGFHGASEILGYEDLYAALASGDAIRVDARAFLRARLVDLLIGDFDRHRKQWRWAKLPDSPLWQPIPEDRDMAFVRADGLALTLARIYVPILQRYDADYPGMTGLTLHGWEQDRWILPALAWRDWQPIVADLEARLDDATIERAIAALPPPWAERDGPRLAAALRGRRDGLAQAARRYYEHLARKVDIQTSDAAHDVEIRRRHDGRTRIVVRRLGAGDDAPDGDAPDADAPDDVLFERSFDPDTTHELRLYLRGGDDRVVVDGGADRIRLHVIAEGGQKRIDDRRGGGLRIHDPAGESEILAGPHTRIDRKPYAPPLRRTGFVDIEEVPPRDWGSETIPIPELGYEPDVGPFLGAQVRHTRYGFRRHPWSSRQSLGFGWAAVAHEPRARYSGRFRPENSPWLAGLDLSYSGIDVLRFYGVGNETSNAGGDRFFRVRNQQFRLMPSWQGELAGDRVRVAAGPFAQYARTRRGDRFIDQLDPYGNGEFGLIGVETRLEIDTRRSVPSIAEELELPYHENPAAGHPTSGFHLDLMARLHPPVWGVERTYGSLRGSLAGYLSPGEQDRVTLAVRVGGQRNFGRTPYFDLAYVGGGRFFSGATSNRGFRTQRFAGEASVYGNADLRVALFRPKIVVPGDLGVHAFVDVGRVFVDHESSDDWHPSGGGGVWFSPLVRTNTISLSVAESREETLAYLRLGFHY